MAIYIEIEKNLAKQPNGKPHSFYKLGKVTGIPQNTLSRLRQGSREAIKKAGKDAKPLDSISFVILEKICRALECEISDILIMKGD